MSGLPDLEPWRTGELAVDGGHRLYFELCGDPAGQPVLALHGGPGSGASPRLRGLYAVDGCRAVLFDQRGAGRSRPPGELHGNDTPALIADIERLREHLGIDRWLVSGGSWGASLAVAYAAQHRAAVSGLLLRSVFLTGAREVDWFFQGAARVRPQDWAALAANVAAGERGDLLAALVRRLSGDERTAAAAAQAWADYERALAGPVTCGAASGAASGAPLDADALRGLIAKYRLQAHYLTHECFLGEASLLAMARSLGGMPTVILHGRRDRVCRPRNALLLHRAIAGSSLQWIAGCGHDPFHPRMVAAWREALRRFVATGAFSGPH